jgi:hypothetical protein
MSKSMDFFKIFKNSVVFVAVVVPQAKLSNYCINESFFKNKVTNRFIVVFGM